ncbi:MAG TPA: sigma-70 family RNA polymerase sigma factor [Thermopolyspora sp.]
MHSESIGGLFRAAVDGDAGAWEALVRNFTPLVWSVVRAHRLAESDCEEVWQTTWLRLAANLDRVKEPERIGGWLASTARHESLKVIRARRRVTLTDDLDLLAPTADDHTPEQAVLDSEQAAVDGERLRRVALAFQQLPDSCRELLGALMASPTPRYAEVAEALDMPIGSIGPRRARCLEHLRKIMGA